MSYALGSTPAQLLRTSAAVLMFVVTGCAGFATQDVTTSVLAVGGHDIIVTVVPDPTALPSADVSPDVAALLGFIASAQFTELTRVAGQPPLYQERNIISLFRDNGPQFVLPDVGPGCGPNANCLGSAPPLTLLTTVEIDLSPVSVLVTGQSEITSILVPQSTGLPLTDWAFTEPVSDLRWSGIFTTTQTTDIIFTAALASKQTPLTANERADISRALAQFIRNTLGE